MKTKRLLFILLLLFFFRTYAQPDTTSIWQVDSIEIKKNWRTRDKIILRELLFSPGESVDQNQLETSISRIWNIGNFTRVDYSFDTLAPNSYLLNIVAKDQFNLVPYVTFSGNSDDRNISMGFSDRNFLGRNIDLQLSGNIGTFKSVYSGQISIPRQLLYKNMTLTFRMSSGNGNNYRYEDDERVSVIAYRSKQFSGAIGNPWHTDYEYTFSPNLHWNLFQHNTDTSLVDTDLPFSGNYKVNYLALSLGESIGLINRIRHQMNGYLVGVGYGVGIGLNKSSPTYHSLSFSASGYKTLNRVVELSAAFSTSYSSNTLPSLITYLSSRHIQGLKVGQESGQGYYNGKLAAGFTYLYFDWFALEHSVYTHLGKASDRYFDIYKSVPRISLGTGFRVWLPTVPWLSARVDFTYIKGNSNWLHLDL